MFTYNYFESKTFLPFKWLVLESIQDKIFNVFSDVWAYGDEIHFFPMTLEEMNFHHF